MVLPIVVFSIESFLILVINAVTSTGEYISEGLSWAIVVFFTLAVASSIVTLVLNVKAMKRVTQGKSKKVVGFVFSIVGLVAAAIFLISFWAAYLSAK